MQFDLHALSVTDILNLSKKIKKKCTKLSCFEDVAQEITKILYESFTTDKGKSPFALVRFFSTCPYDHLTEDIQTYIQRKEQNEIPPLENRYLTLMGTYGDREELRNRKDSKNYQSFPLADPHFHTKFPMFSAVFKQIGIEILASSQLDMSILIKERHERLGFFCVENAVGSKLIPKQSEFVEPFAIQSAFGFGGIYPTGNAYIIIIFSHEKITREHSRLFLSLNPAIKWSSLEHETSGNIFKANSSSLQSLNISHHTDTKKDMIPRHDVLSSQKKAIDVEKEKTHALIEELEITNEYLMQTTEELNKSNTIIRSGEEKLRKITESAFDAIVIIDTHGLINFWNNAAEEMFGYERGEVLGKDVHKVIVPKTYYDSYLEGFSLFRNTGTGALIGKKIVLPAIKKNGTTFYAEHSFAAFGTNGSWNAVSIIRDCTDQIQKQDTLIKNELILKTAQKIAHLGCWEWDITNNSETWSDEQFRIFGYEPGEVEANYDLFLNALHPEDKAKVLQAVHDAFYNNIPYSIEFRIIRPDTTILTVHSQGDIFRDANGMPIRMIGTVLDITERKLTESRLRELNESLELLVKKRTNELEQKNKILQREINNRRKIENALRESEKRFRVMIEQAAVGVALIETKTDHFVLLNKKYCDIIGYTMEEVCKKTFREITHPDDLQADLNNMQKLIRGEISEFSMEKRYFHKTGSIVWVTLTASAMWKKGETPDFHIAIAEDITTRKLAEEQLKESERRYQDLYENLPDMYASIDIGTKTIVQCNRTLIKSLGYESKEDLIGKNITFIYHPDCIEKVHSFLHQFMKTGEIRNAELQLRKKDGGKIEVSLNVTAIRDIEAKIIRTRSVWRDITEYKRIESQVRKLAKFPSENPYPVLRISKDGIVLYLNKAGEAFLNTWNCKLNEAVPAEVHKTISDTLATGTKAEMKMVINDRIFSTTFAPVLNEGYVNLYGKDITDREKALTSLQESQARIQLLLNSTGEAIYGIDTQGHCTFVNTSCLKLLGYDNSDQLIGKNMHYLIHYKDRNGRRLPFEECIIYQAYLSGHGTHGTEEVFWRAAGSFFPVECKSFPIYKENKTLGVVVSFTNISERKQMEDKLKKLSLAVEQSVCTIVITDRDGTIQYVNPKFTDITGYTYEEAIGQNPRILKSGKTTDEEYIKLWKKITSGNSWQGEFYNKKKNGDYFWELAEISPIKDQNGNITNFLAIKEDITAKKQKEEERMQLREQLFHAQRLESVGRLSGGIAHDFNNFLMAISGYTNLLQLMFSDNDTALSYLHNIQISTEKASHLTKNLLAFSKKQVIQSKPVDLNAIIKEIDPLIQQLLDENIKCAIEYTNNKLIVTVDKLQIEQVLMNLATNARDAMPDGGTLTIQTRVEHIDDYFIAAKGFGIKGTCAAVSISDTGTGMDEETKAKIFEPFFTTKGADKGTGLGLSTTYGIVKQHDGHIDVFSKKGEGTTFTLYFPMNDIPPEEIIQPSATSEVLTKGSETILVAEDDESVRTLIKEVLERFGYIVIAASDGDGALQKYKENANALKLLILDVKMPRKDGKKVYDEVMLTKPEMKIVFLSGYTDSIIPQNIVQNKNVHFIQKPVLPTKLVKQVNEILK